LYICIAVFGRNAVLWKAVFAHEISCTLLEELACYTKFVMNYSFQLLSNILWSSFSTNTGHPWPSFVNSCERASQLVDQPEEYHKWLRIFFMCR
jgi:hypothetical protein